MPKVSRSRKIKTLAEFKKLAKRSEGVEYHILLNGGLRSSKFCVLNGDTYYIENYIDSSEEKLTLKEFKETNTYNALIKGCLYLYLD